MSEWKDIEGWPYQICKEGLVMNKKSGRILKQYIDDVGYYQVTLCNNGIPKKLRLHRLLAEVFILNPDNYTIVDHIDHNRTNNKLENLRWVSRYINNSNKTKKSKSGELHIFLTHVNTFRVIIRSNDSNIDKSFKTLQEAIDYRDSVIS